MRTSTHYANHETPRAAYAAMITRMDRDIGRLMDRLKALGLDDHTLVLFGSDNGAAVRAVRNGPELLPQRGPPPRLQARPLRRRYPNPIHRAAGRAGSSQVRQVTSSVPTGISCRLYATLPACRHRAASMA